MVIKSKEAELLNLRNQPEFAIITAVEYAVINMKALLKSSYEKGVAKITNDSDKAKLYYLTHHLGNGDALRFIGNTIPDTGKDNAQYLLAQQVNYTDKKTNTLVDVAAIKAKAEKEHGVADDSCYIFAHRRWLIAFIDDNIDPKAFAVDIKKIAEPRPLYDLIKDIGGQHPAGFVVPPKHY